MRTRYRPVDNGYEIIGGHEVFNRALYGAAPAGCTPGPVVVLPGHLRAEAAPMKTVRRFVADRIVRDW